MPESKAARTTTDLVRLLTRSGILTAQQLDQVAQLAEQAPSARKLARRLIAKNLLTRWQASQLLAGWYKLQLGKYRLCEQIERSETGRVFRAEHIQLDRQVAIKTLSRRFTRDAQIVQQFLDEARAVSQLDHGNILHVFDIDQEEDLYFLIMEYIEGDDLQRLVMDQGPLAHDMVIEILRQAASGLAYLHELGVIHRDLCPANVMLDEHGQVKLIGLGFGMLASACHPPADQHPVKTNPWLAPELLADNGLADPRTDIYGLGCIARWLLTGPILDTDHAEPDAGSSRPMSVPRGEIPLPSDLPADFVAVLDKMCARNPDDRFQTAGEVLSALAPLADDPENAIICPSLDTGTEPVTTPAMSRPGFPGPNSGVSEADAPPEIDTTTDQPSTATRPANSGPLPGEETFQTVAAAGEETILPFARRHWQAIVVVTVLSIVLLVGSAFAIFWRPSPPPPGNERPGRAPENKRTTPVIQPSRTDDRQKPPTVGSSMPTAGAVGPNKHGPRMAVGRISPKGGTQTKNKKKTPGTGVPAKPSPRRAAPPTTTKPPASRPPEPKEDPFGDLPTAIQLPLPGDTDKHVLQIGPANLSPGTPCTLSLLGTSEADASQGYFRITKRGTGEHPDWTVVLQDADSATAVAIAEIPWAAHEFTIRWAAAAERTARAANLMNCVLRFQSGRFQHDVCLRTPAYIPPLLVNLKKTTTKSESKIIAPPDLERIRVEIRSLEPPLPQDFALEPDHAVPIPRKVEEMIRITMQGDASALQLRLAPNARLVPGGNGVFGLKCTAYLQLNPAMPAQLMTPKALMNAKHFVVGNQLLRNADAQRIRQAIARLKRQDPSRKKQMNVLKRAEAELERAAQLTGRFETLQKLRTDLADGAAIHFRVFFMVDDRAVDLLRSDVPPNGQ